jgi:deoxyribonuclease-4
MHLVGAHVDAEGGVQNAPLNAHAIDCRAFALFTRNQRRWTAPALSDDTIAAFKANCLSCGYLPEHILAHDSYLINLGSPDAAARERSLEAFVDEMTRCEQLGIPSLNCHPGNHMGGNDEEGCMRLIAGCINHALSQTRGVSVVLENTSGQGTSVGFRFEHLAYIIEHVTDQSRVGFCIDTCHAFCAGYEIRTTEGWERTMREADRAIGLRFLRGMHLNDSMHELGSRKDRHELIGKGCIGRDAFRAVMRDSRLEGIPLILETPNQHGWAREIRSLYRMAEPKPVSTTQHKRTGKAQVKRVTQP